MISKICEHFNCTTINRQVKSIYFDYTAMNILDKLGEQNILQ